MNNTKLYTTVLKTIKSQGTAVIESRLTKVLSKKDVRTPEYIIAIDFLLENNLVSSPNKEDGYGKRIFSLPEHIKSMLNNEEEINSYLEKILDNKSRHNPLPQNITVENYHQSIVSKGDNINQGDLSLSSKSPLTYPPNQKDINTTNKISKKVSRLSEASPNRMWQIILGIVGILTLIVTIYKLFKEPN